MKSLLDEDPRDTAKRIDEQLNQSLEDIAVDISWMVVLNRIKLKTKTADSTPSPNSDFKPV